MKLIETIERCEKLVLEEIEVIEDFLNNSESKFGEKTILEWNEEKNKLLEDLSNLRLIKFESNILELDDVIEEQNETN